MSSRYGPRLFAVALALTAPCAALAAKLPVIDGKEAVASVNGEPILLEDLLAQLSALHEGVAEPQAKVHRPDPSALLDRLINVRLILQEARNIGLDELPEVTSQVDSIRMQAIRSSLVRRQAGDVKEADPNVVDRVYRDMIREWKVSSVLFEREDDAQGFAAAVENGGEFDSLVKQVVDSNVARGAEVGEYEKASNFLSEVAQLLSKLKVGGAGGPVKLDNGFAVVKLLDERFPDDEQQREQAREMVLQGERQTRLREYTDELRDKYTSIDREVLDSLDFDAGPENLERLRADDRKVAQVKGAGPITVKDLTAAVEKKFYHGLESAMERKRVTAEVPAVLDRMLLERASELEAKRLGIEKTDEFNDTVREQLNGLLFAQFIAKAVNPGIKLDEDELKRYYADHAADYSSPAMMRIDGFAFARRKDAEEALERLRQGADLKWIRENAGELATTQAFPDMLQFDGSLLAVPTMPDGVQKALAGAAEGDDRFYAATGGPYYILHVREVFAPQPRPYDSVRKEIGEKLVERKQEAALEEWGEKLRAASDVEVYATGSALDEILGLKFAADKTEAGARNLKTGKGKSND